jgi:hypothetical protein
MMAQEEIKERKVLLAIEPTEWSGGKTIPEKGKRDARLESEAGTKPGDKIERLTLLSRRYPFHNPTLVSLTFMRFLSRME